MSTISKRLFCLQGGFLLPLLSGLCVAALHGQTLYNFGNPTADEQLYIEFVNRARANPPAEGARLAAITDPDILSAYSYFDVDLAMMQGEFNAIAAQPPLAPNANLTTAARGHSAWMLANHTQSHDETNPFNTSATRMFNAGYDYQTVGENIYASSKNAWYGHAGFQVDWGTGSTGGMQSGRGHRTNIHSASFREIGVGVTLGTNVNVGPQQVTQDFGARFSSPSFGTGVAYYDLNANNFYDAGEGISGLTVNVAGASNYCITAAGGGWTVPIPSTAATRSVSFTGLGMNQAVNLVVPASKNAKADLKLTYSSPTITSSATAYAGVSHSLAFTAVAGATGYQWKRWDINAASDENCESAANVTSSTSGSYGIRNTNVKQQGASSFHLENSTGTSQSIQLGSLYFGHVSAALAFQSRIRTSSSSEHFKVQVKEEGSTTWQDVYDQTGGTAENSFSLRNAPLTGMNGKFFRVRFVLNFISGSYYPYSGDTYGWFIDALNFSNVSALTNLSSQLLTGTSGSFTPSSDSHLMSIAPVISGLEFPASSQILTGGPKIVVEEPVGIALVSGISDLNFGNADISASVTKTVTIRNIGTANLTSLAVSRSGANASDFTLGALGSVTLAPGASTTFTVTFTPAAAGSSGASLQIASNDMNKNPFGIMLGGTGVVTVNQPAAITTPPASVTINSGETTTLSVTASGTAPFTYQWYQGTSGTTTNPVGINSASFTTPALTTTTTSYWVKVTNAANLTGANSATATVTVNQPAAITTPPASVTINSGETTTLSVTAAGTAPFTYQWYQGTSGTTTTPVGTNSASFTTPALTATTSYWVKVTNAANLAGANSATATVTLSRFTLTTSGSHGAITGSGNYDGMTSATLQATADPGYVFSSWIGDASGSSNPLTLLMDSNKNVGAIFSSTAPYDITFVGTPYELRVGNQVTFDLNRLLINPGETLKVGGKIPPGLKFNATTGMLAGTLTGKAGTYQTVVQVLQGKTVVRTITFPITVLEFPTSLIGSFDFLMEDSNSIPVGVCKVIITGANKWSATLECAGASKKRSAKGTFILAEGSPIAPITAFFPAMTGASAVTVNIPIDGSTPVITGTYDGGTLRGFRIAKVGEMPPAAVAYNLVLDAGEQDGINVPAGYGWLKGKVSNKGLGTFKGLLGDGTAASITLRLSPYGQAILWSQPYKNKSSYIGGIVTLGNLGQTTPGEAPLEDEIWWTKAADAKTLSYPNGFPGMTVTVGTSRWTVPATAAALGESLGWRYNTTAKVTIDGGGLSNQEPQATTAKLPTLFSLDDKFNLLSTAPVVWKGKVSKTDGAISGTLTLPSGFSSQVSVGGAAVVSGVLVQDESWDTVTGCGQIKVPTSGLKGSFRTASIVLGQ